MGATFQMLAEITSFDLASDFGSYFGMEKVLLDGSIKTGSSKCMHGGMMVPSYQAF